MSRAERKGHLGGRLFLALANGELSPAQLMDEGLGHLEALCPRCRAVLEGYPGLRPAAPGADERFGPAVERVAEHSGALEREHEEARELLGELLDRRLEEALGLLVSSPRLRTWGVAAALLGDASEAVLWGPASVARAVATLAATAGARLEGSRYPAWLVEDLRSATCATLAEALLRFGDVEEAGEELSAAEEHRLRGSGTWLYDALVEVGRVRLELARGRPRAAARRAGLVLEQARAGGDAALVVQATHLLASASADAGSAEVALIALELGEAAWTAHGGLAPQWPAALRIEVARGYAACGSFEEALTELELARGRLPRLYYPLLDARLERVRGGALHGLARLDEAEEALTAARRAAVDLGEGLEAARAALDLALLHAHAGRHRGFARAVEDLAEVLRVETLPSAAAAVLLRFQVRARRDGPDPEVVAAAREALHGAAERGEGAVH